MVCCIWIAACRVSRRNIQRWKTSCQSWGQRMIIYAKYDDASLSVCLSVCLSVSILHLTSFLPSLFPSPLLPTLSFLPSSLSPLPQFLSFLSSVSLTVSVCMCVFLSLLCVVFNMPLLSVSRISSMGCCHYCMLLFLFWNLQWKNSGHSVCFFFKFQKSAFHPFILQLFFFLENLW